MEKENRTVCQGWEVLHCVCNTHLLITYTTPPFPPLKRPCGPFRWGLNKVPTFQVFSGYCKLSCWPFISAQEIFIAGTSSLILLSINRSVTSLLHCQFIKIILPLRARHIAIGPGETGYTWPDSQCLQTSVLLAGVKSRMWPLRIFSVFRFHTFWMPHV